MKSADGFFDGDETEGELKREIRYLTAQLSELRSRVEAAVDFVESDHDLDTRGEVLAKLAALLSPEPKGAE